MIERCFRLWVAGVVLALAAACAGPQAGTSTSVAELSANAVVVLSVSHNSEAGRRIHASFTVDAGSADARVLRSVEEVLMIPTGSDFEEDYGKVFVLLMKPGRHEISNWQIRQQSGLRVFPKNPPAPLVFEVKAGETIYLGNLFMNISLAGGLLPGTWVTQGGRAEVRDRRDIDLPIALKKNPTLQGKVVPRPLPVGPWLIDGSGTSRSVDPIGAPVPAKSIGR